MIRLFLICMLLVNVANAGDVFFGGLKLGTTFESYDTGNNTRYLFMKPYLGMRLSDNVFVEANFEKRNYDDVMSQTVEAETTVNTTSDKRFLRLIRSNNRYRIVRRKVNSSGVATTVLNIDEPQMTYRGTLMLHIKF